MEEGRCSHFRGNRRRACRLRRRGKPVHLSRLQCLRLGREFLSTISFGKRDLNDFGWSPFPLRGYQRLPLGHGRKRLRTAGRRQQHGSLFLSASSGRKRDRGGRRIFAFTLSQEGRQSLGHGSKLGRTTRRRHQHRAFRSDPGGERRGGSCRRLSSQHVPQGQRFALGDGKKLRGATGHRE